MTAITKCKVFMFYDYVDTGSRFSETEMNWIKI